MQDIKNKKAVAGWISYDWAAQPYHTLLVTFVFAPYFASTVVGNSIQGQVYWGYMVGIVGLLLAFAAPLLGAVADASGPRKPWVMLFSIFHVFGAFALWWALPGMESVFWILIVFGIGFIGVELSQVFINAMLPDLVQRKNIGLISGWGLALGYAGGLVGLVIMLLFLAENGEGKTMLGAAPLFGLDASAREGTRSVGPFTAIWYVIFMVPFFLWVFDAPKKVSQKAPSQKRFRN